MASSKSVLIVSDIHKKDLFNLYIKNKMNLKEIGFFYGLSCETIRKKLKKFNIPIRNRAIRNQNGVNHGNFKINPSYRTLHKRVEYTRGKPNYCMKCLTINPYIDYEWANISGKYIDVNDFIRLCTSCHKKEHIRSRDSWGRFI